jgi:fructose-1,6-bisphosphatase/inositol monophosphatase family enzyme
LEVWDLTALLPALKGCGASFSDWSGGDNIGKNGLVASCNATMHKKVLQILNPQE